MLQLKAGTSFFHENIRWAIVILRIVGTFYNMDSMRLPRVDSIDILRALTMLLMIFVNDLGNVIDVPAWLEHTAKLHDGMGLADTVFPAFLVISGMSIPFAIENRKRKGESDRRILGHILERSFSLLVMGVFLVNGEHIDSETMEMPAYLYDTFSCLAFIFIWNAFPQHVNRSLVNALKILGWFILIILAWAYRGNDDGEIVRFNTWWWGILGLIGWAYLFTSIVFLWGKGRLSNMLIFWVLCMLISVSYHGGLIMKKSFLSALTMPVGHGAMPALVCAGAIVSLLFSRLVLRHNTKKLIIVLLSVSAGSVALGFLLRKFFIISKILATPSWVMICIGITIAIFVLVYWIADIRKITAWTKIIKGAGTNTLLCYLLPYFAYALFAAFHLYLPDVLLTGGVGLFKTFLFAVLIAWVAGKARNINIRLKI